MDKDEDKEFDQLLQEKRYKELSGTMRDIHAILSQKTDNKTVSAIERQETIIKRLIDEVKNTPKLRLNQEEIVTSVQKVTSDILKALTELRQELNKSVAPKPIKPKKWIFDIKRNYGYIESVTATEQP